MRSYWAFNVIILMSKWIKSKEHFNLMWCITCTMHNTHTHDSQRETVFFKIGSGIQSNVMWNESKQFLKELEYITLKTMTRHTHKVEIVKSKKNQLKKKKNCTMSLLLHRHSHTQLTMIYFEYFASFCIQWNRLQGN